MSNGSCSFHVILRAQEIQNYFMNFSDGMIFQIRTLTFLTIMCNNPLESYPFLSVVVLFM